MMLSAEEILKKYWGYEEFRPMQKEIIQSVINRSDILALLPTGGGKSICYQIPALMQDGICLVISPLIALMKDQVNALKKRGIPAIAVFSGMTAKEIDIAFDNCIYGKTKFLYLSPERLTTNMARERILKMNINLLAVDEAHCISQWGYDFRPPYLQISDFREWKPTVPVLALTATATTKVVKDIQNKLKFRKPCVLRKSFKRDNLAYLVLYDQDKRKRLLQICKKVQGCGIVYVRNRKKTKQIADFLLKNKINTTYYHAGLDYKMRDKNQSLWIKGKTPVIVATNAFGMGIDKPNVRFVVHLDLPDSIESYFQEAGRAGRDIKKAWAVLMYSDADRMLMEKNFANSFPAIKDIRCVYQALANHLHIATGAGKGNSYDFDLGKFCSTYGFMPLHTYHCLKFMAKEGLISISDSVALPSRIKFLGNKETLYHFQLQNEKLDLLIKVFLRSYPGLFESYVAFDESVVAERAACSREDMKRYLATMSQYKIISYLPQKDTPQITFNIGRLKASELVIKPENLEIIKKQSQERMESFLHYLETKNKCRSNMLLAYFGEKDQDNCGVCDVCLDMNNNQLTNTEFKNLSDRLKQLLSEKPHAVDEVINKMNSKEEKILELIRFMLDNKLLCYTNDNKIMLVQ